MTENGLFLNAGDISVPEKALKLFVKTHDYKYIKFRFVIVGRDMKLKTQHTECNTVLVLLRLLFILLYLVYNEILF